MASGVMTRLDLAREVDGGLSGSPSMFCCESANRPGCCRRRLKQGSGPLSVTAPHRRRVSFGQDADHAGDDHSGVLRTVATCVYFFHICCASIWDVEVEYLLVACLSDANVSCGDIRPHHETAGHLGTPFGRREPVPAGPEVW